MKKIILLTTLFFSIFAVSQAQYSIKGKIKGVPKDSSCILAHYYGKVQYIPKDTAKVDENGAMVFSGKTPLPGGVYLVVLPTGGWFEILIPDAQHQTFSFETDTASPILKMKIKGSDENIYFYEYQRTMIKAGMKADSIQKLMKGAPAADSLALLEQLKSLDAEINVFKDKFMADHANTFTSKIIKAAWDPVVPDEIRRDQAKSFYYYRNHYFDNIDFSDERMVRTPLFQTKLERYMKDLTVQSVDSIIKSADYIVGKASANKELFKYSVWYITNTYETSQIMCMDAVFVHMARKYYLSGKAFWIDSATYKKIKERADVTEPLLCNRKARNIHCTDSLGNIIPLHSVKAKYTILYFWDPNCGHCQKVTPKLYEFYQKYKSKGIAVYSVSIDREEAKWKKYINDHKLYDWINVWDSKTMTDFHNWWDITSTPQVYILDENKMIIAKKIGVEQIEDYFVNFLWKKDSK